MTDERDLKARIAQLEMLLSFAGRLANAARATVGGEVNGVQISPASLDNIGPRIRLLHSSLDEYDQAILEAIK